VRVGTLLAVVDTEVELQSDTQIKGQADTQEATAAPFPSLPISPATNFVSPVVARLVAEHNLDVGKISGSGQGGRVTKQDVLKYVEAHRNQPSRLPASAKPTDDHDRAAETAASPQPAEAISPIPAAADSVSQVTRALPEDAEIIPLSPMRRSIAEHMLRSRHVAPHVTTVFEVDVGQIVAHHDRRKAEFERQGVKLTYTPYFVQAAVAGLQAVPMVNGSYAESGIIVHQRMHIGVAVALEEGLIVPVIRDADEKNLLGLARAVNELAERARARRLKPDETQGGTFTITNHGVGGSLFATPIINQPQAAILGIGAIQKRVVVISQAGVDAIAIRPMCYLSLTIDHRLLDGATADQFLTAIKRFLESYAE